MKKIYLLLVFVFAVSFSFSQTLFTYGNTSVDKDEFIRAYNKNKTPVADKEKALREYLDLYIKFKLKVSAARELRLDTIPQLLFDAQNFRSQIEESYLNNEKELNNLLEEAFNRSQRDLHTLHFFAPIDISMSPEDSMKAYKAINDLYASLATGKTEYSKLIEDGQGKVKQSDIGFITAFTLPYEYENLIYNLRVGQVSKPYRSKKGWHVFKLIEERKGAGKWKIAQILLATPPGQQNNDKAALGKKADSVYQMLQKGVDFALLARQFSDDKITYGTGGELPEFGSGKFDPSFESEVFKLSRDGEISRPFLSSYGYHIIKRISHTPIPADKNDNAFLFDLKQKVQQDSRVNGARESFTKEILKQVSFKNTGAVPEADLFRYADSALAHPSSETGNVSIYPFSNKVIYASGKAKITGKDWLDFILNYKANSELYQGENNAALLQKFISTTAIEYYKKHLEDYNADFRYQMEEFKDGNVLFEIMERNIWGRAASDTVGLLKQYNENKSKYTWAASADIILFNCSNKAVAEKAREALKSGKEWKRIADDANTTLQADSGRFELSQVPTTIDPKSAAGSITEIVTNPADGTASFAKIVKQYEANLQRNFDEARGLVINDYQNILEEKWITGLKKKYPVKINEAVFQSLLK
jgi:peptidyl-prolyl cis-trans isomerase SurA